MNLKNCTFTYFLKLFDQILTGFNFFYGMCMIWSTLEFTLFSENLGKAWKKPEDKM